MSKRSSRKRRNRRNRQIGASLITRAFPIWPRCWHCGKKVEQFDDYKCHSCQYDEQLKERGF